MFERVDLITDLPSMHTRFQFALRNNEHVTAFKRTMLFVSHNLFIALDILFLYEMVLY